MTLKSAIPAALAVSMEKCREAVAFPVEEAVSQVEAVLEAAPAGALVVVVEAALEEVVFLEGEAFLGKAVLVRSGTV